MNHPQPLPLHPVASMTGDVRIGPVMSIPGLLRKFGVTPRSAFRQAGVGMRLFANSDSRIPFEALVHLLNVCERLTGCEHFGLLVGERFRLEALGTVGKLMRNSATVGEALRALLLHLHLYDRGAVPVLAELDPSSLLLGYAAYGQRMPSMAQAYDASVAMGFRMMQELCGPSWTPLRAQFSRLRPGDTAVYRRVFRSRLRFDAEACGVVFASTWLDQPIAGADPALRGLLARAIEDAENRSTMSFAEQVECALLQLALNGTTSARDVSRCFGIHDRTLRKRLRAEGTSLQTLLDRTRFGIARQLLGETGLSVAEVSSALRFSDPNVFSRAFRNWAGVSPREWRRRLAQLR